MNFLDKLERKYGKYAIKDLMKYIVILNFAVYLVDNIVYPGGYLRSWLILSPSHVMNGQVWRLLTFVLIPPSTSTLWILFALYFYYMIGSSLEGEWGSFKFNIYYLTGIVGTVIGAFITGGVATAVYLNMSLFLAFAYFYPNYQIMLFFVIPMKIKYLALIDVLLLLSSFFTSGLTDKIVIIAALLNFFLFFGKDMLSHVKTRQKVVSNRKNFKDSRPKVIYIYRCTICGATEKSHPNMEFRYCSKCDGHHAYCSEHLLNHEHIKEDK
ncbi:hypothetical protein SDC9_152978 [bioreactor metagenome]|uniref:Peptidase S54 rhomboid domain-containing protein n=1 Tax=bioreactor metagenome TaxID=1076179 RepID=A0A645EUM4_9ZZZZ